MSTYAERLKDPRWQRRRLEILQRADFTCEQCGSKDRTLHVHHLLYRKGAMPWEYEDHELRSLCEPCHEWWHTERALMDAALARLTGEQLLRVRGYVHAVACGDPAEFPSNALISIQTTSFAHGVADALVDWNCTPREFIADQLVDHGVVDQALHDSLGEYSEFGLPEPKRGAA